jgi:hypothetical protein
VDQESTRERPLFAVGPDVYRWEDVVVFARLRGDWDALAGEVCAGLGALRAVDHASEDEIENAGREFRYARGLVSGDQLVEWLEGRGVSTTEWRAYLERLIARTRSPEGTPPRVFDKAEVEASMWAEGMCSGQFDRVANDLARRLAVSPGVSFDALDEEFAMFCRAAESSDLVAREIELNRLEWLRFAYETAEFENEDAALEAALCVRTDGDSMAVVANRANVALEERVDWLDEVEPELASRFLAARPGDLLGPVPTGAGFRLALLQDKVAPSEEDEAVQRRASNAVVERAIEREVNERVVWYEPL